jgi:hypothetical protein
MVKSLGDYPQGSREDRKMLAKTPFDQCLDYFFLQIRNIWRIDGLYFLEIEKEFGTEAATEIDARVWENMAAIEAKSLQRMFKIGENPDVATIVDLLRKSSWALDQPFKTIKIDSKRVTLSVDKCRTQEARMGKGLHEFPCKKVRFRYLKSFAKILNPKATVNCLVCPPDEHSQDLWCLWEFTVEV